MSDLDDRHLLVTEVPPGGKAIRITLTPRECGVVAKDLDLPSVASIAATLRAEQFGADGIAIGGTIEARFSYTCVVSLEAFETQETFPVDIRFSPDGIDPFDESEALETLLDGEGDDLPDRLVDGKVDLSAIVFEFFALGLDPYPRKPGIAFEAPVAGEEGGPFAELAKLKKPE